MYHVSWSCRWGHKLYWVPICQSYRLQYRFSAAKIRCRRRNRYFAGEEDKQEEWRHLQKHNHKILPELMRSFKTSKNDFNDCIIEFQLFMLRYGLRHICNRRHIHSETKWKCEVPWFGWLQIETTSEARTTSKATRCNSACTQWQNWTQWNSDILLGINTTTPPPPHRCSIPFCNYSIWIVRNVPSSPIRTYEDYDDSEFFLTEQERGTCIV